MIEKHFALSTKNPLTAYDALQDKHASFYFNGYGIKKHLKRLKKAIDHDPFQRGHKQYTQMLNQKLTELQERNQPYKQKIKPYEQTLKPSSLHKLQKMNFVFNNGKNTEKILKNENHLQKKQNISFQNLPTININKNLIKIEEPNNMNEKRGQQMQKQQKSISLADKLSSMKINPINPKKIDRDRSNKSVQMRNSNKKISYENDPVKQVKHQDFLDFLKKRQDDLLKANKTIQPYKSSAEIKQQAYDQL